MKAILPSVVCDAISIVAGCMLCVSYAIVTGLGIIWTSWVHSGFASFQRRTAASEAFDRLKQHTILRSTKYKPECKTSES